MPLLHGRLRRQDPSKGEYAIDLTVYPFQATLRLNSRDIHLGGFSQVSHMVDSSVGPIYNQLVTSLLNTGTAGLRNDTTPHRFG